MNSLEDIKTVAETLAGLTTFIAGVGAAIWFIRTTQYKPRVQFDLDSRCFAPTVAEGAPLLELAFIFENKGFVEHRLYDLTVSVHGMRREPAPTDAIESPTEDFPVRLLPRTVVVNPDYGHFFVRPGVRQVITRPLRIAPDIAAVRVTAGFCYSQNSKYPHTAQRIFAVDSFAQTLNAAARQADTSSW